METELEWLKEMVRRQDTGRYEDRMVLTVYKVKQIIAEWETDRQSPASAGRNSDG